MSMHKMRTIDCDVRETLQKIVGKGNINRSAENITRPTRINNATERNMAFALSELDRMASAIGLPRNVRESAVMIYKEAINRNLIRGRSIENVAVAALYCACRQCSVPRTFAEMASISRLSKKEIGRIYRFIARELKLKLMPVQPEDYVYRFCSELKLSDNVLVKTNEILQKTSEKELAFGRAPTGVVATAIYAASIICDERKMQREIADVAGVSEVTIRKRYKELSEKLKKNEGEKNLMNIKKQMCGEKGSNKKENRMISKEKEEVKMKSCWEEVEEWLRQKNSENIKTGKK